MFNPPQYSYLVGDPKSPSDTALAAWVAVTWPPAGQDHPAGHGHRCPGAGRGGLVTTARSAPPKKATTRAARAPGPCSTGRPAMPCTHQETNSNRLRSSRASTPTAAPTTTASNPWAWPHGHLRPRPVRVRRHGTGQRGGGHYVSSASALVMSPASARHLMRSPCVPRVYGW
jgi:hypothetical protein